MTALTSSVELKSSLEGSEGAFDGRCGPTFWYAVYTRSRHEQFVKKQLDGKKIHNFLPVYEKLSSWKDRMKRIQVPLFPGYLFVNIVPGERVGVLKTCGIVNLVGNGTGPLPIPENQIEAIQNFTDKGLRYDPHPYLKVGQRVRISSGPLSGAEGILIRKKGRCRLVVSVDLIQRSVSIEIDTWTVERI